MPFVKWDIEGEPPDQPHLGLLTDNSGAAIAIPPGATMYLILDPSRADKVIPLVLFKVSLKKLEFLCACGNRKCSKRYVFVAQNKGFHPPEKRSTAYSAPDATAPSAPSQSTDSQEKPSSESGPAETPKE